MQALGDQRLRAHRAGYLGSLAFVDTCVGHVLDALDEHGLADNTIIVYTSDHGEMDGDHGLFQKFCMFEPSVKVPLIVSYPKGLPHGEVTAALTGSIGLYPTLTELAGVDPPGPPTLVEWPEAPSRIDARSFAVDLRDPDLEGPPAAFSEYNLRSPVAEYMIREPRYKLVHNHGATHELYDLEADPGECVNRIDDPGFDSIRNDLRDRLFAWYDPEATPFRPQRAQSS
jgi:choline-sulfatase